MGRFEECTLCLQCVLTGSHLYTTESFLTLTGRTGQGKTLAFVLPIVERLLAHNISATRRQQGRTPRVIVLAPTRELAKQVPLRSLFIIPLFVPRSLQQLLNTQHTTVHICVVWSKE